ncbi:MAG: hypothetical protein ACJAVP_001143 [Spirosomataceae bacterium]|jgi:hypothetical protein
MIKFKIEDSFFVIVYVKNPTTPNPMPKWAYSKVFILSVQLFQLRRKIFFLDGVLAMSTFHNSIPTSGKEGSPKNVSIVAQNGD